MWHIGRRGRIRKNRKSSLKQRALAHNSKSASRTNLQESPVASGKRVSRKAAPVNENANSSVRTLILGIDRDGRIVQSDKTAPKILARPTGELLGVHLNDIMSQANGVSPDDAAAGSEEKTRCGHCSTR